MYFEVEEKERKEHILHLEPGTKGRVIYAMIQGRAQMLLSDSRQKYCYFDGN